MGQPLHRTQVLLEPQQHRELTRIAAEEDRSLSDLLREIVRRDLERRRAQDEADLRTRIAALERIREHRRQALAERGGRPIELDPAELIREARDERTEEIWEAIRGGNDRR